jgi:hypothetical protein
VSFNVCPTEYGMASCWHGFVKNFFRSSISFGRKYIECTTTVDYLIEGFFLLNGQNETSLWRDNCWWSKGSATRPRGSWHKVSPIQNQAFESSDLLPHLVFDRTQATRNHTTAGADTWQRVSLRGDVTGEFRQCLECALGLTGSKLGMRGG